MSTHLLAYCRPGFEPECGDEIGGFLLRQGIDCEIERGQGWVRVRYTSSKGDRLPVWRELVFARQLLLAEEPVALLSERDRLTPILAAAKELGGPFCDIWLETPDTNEAKQLSGFCRRFGEKLLEAAAAEGLLSKHPRAPRLHLFFTDMQSVTLALAAPEHTSPWPMGIPRLKMPFETPSRSTLKLAEAFLTLVPEDELKQRLRSGQHAVDLGAAPGGWTWQLVSRGLRVAAVDNGPLKGIVADHPHVRHERADGFRFKPKKPVDWVVCDMVEQPNRIAALMAQWLAEGHARQAIFNLKLPMKKRLDAVSLCFDLIDDRLRDADVPYKLNARQLYHDREEITVYLRRR
ncbi:23S rRNA (cytidine(2498)-2'-O)-methyltransferase RlmM [Parachitinimonas caeni]|uniref:Ribosomal RNA large subunit methyltransferase M n=1 Tax=Parachitinimonas caeni TaxID=3031301 RepID=A0ABT7DXL5_9NEIS|nr:23S rRNA (cytidine(2498)-2'-O)-methyltransferase RlmM [Parachitinimonas caeni]MDK2124775.1 23S rRNA (cytidine(2498)-2'-O)-methyltransferase RlmM [Parachitinimonas caeni]